MPCSQLKISYEIAGSLLFSQGLHVRSYSYREASRSELGSAVSPNWASFLRLSTQSPFVCQLDAILASKFVFITFYLQPEAWGKFMESGNLYLRQQKEDLREMVG